MRSAWCSSSGLWSEDPTDTPPSLGSLDPHPRWFVGAECWHVLSVCDACFMCRVILCGGCTVFRLGNYCYDLYCCVVCLFVVSPAGSRFSVALAVLTPKPSLLRKRNKRNELSGRRSSTALLDGAGWCCEAAHLKRTGEGCNPTSGSFAPTSSSATAAA